MTVNNTINNLSAGNQYSSVQISQEPTKKSATSNSISPPGISNILFAPLEFVDNIVKTVKAGKIDDHEGMVQHGVRVAQKPVSFAGSLSQSLLYMIELGVLLKICSHSIYSSFSSIAKGIGAAGLFICLIEGILECVGLGQSVYFYKKFYPFELAKKKDQAPGVEEKVYFDCLSKIHSTYTFTGNLAEEKRRNYLHRRVQTDLGNEIIEKSPLLLKDLQSADPSTRRSAVQKAAELFDLVKTQHYKNILIRVVGLLAIAIAATSLTLALLGSPSLLLLGFFIVGTGSSIGRNFLGAGLLESKGWQFNIQRCIPAWVKKVHAYMTAPAPQKELPKITPLHVDIDAYLQKTHPRKWIDYTLTMSCPSSL